MKMLHAIALIATLSGLAPVATKAATIDVATGFEYTSTSGPALIAEIEADGLTIVGSGAGLIASSSFFSNDPTEGSRFLRVRMSAAADTTGGEEGILGSVFVFKDDVFKVDYLPRHLESSGSTHIDSYLILAMLFDDEGTAISDPLILAQGTSEAENFLDWQTGSITSPGTGTLGYGIFIFHDEGIQTGRPFNMSVDNVRVERAPAVVPIPPALLLFTGAFASFIGVRRRKV